MLIDWFTILAQIINFLILLFLLKRFLYGPIIAAMNAREQRVVSRLEEAQRQRTEAEQEAASYRRKQAELDQRREALIREAEESARRRRQELIEEARTEADRLRSGWRAALEQQKTSFLRDLRQRTSEQVLQIVRHVLHDLADADLEQQMIALFLQRLEHLDQATRHTLEQALAQSRRTARVCSAFELNSAQQHQIEAGAQDQFGENVELVFETAPELIGGLALTVGNHELAWNLQNYLDSLDETIARVFAEELPVRM